jgi:hypothetical protein
MLGRLADLTGTVTDAATGNPLAGAEVRIAETGSRVLTGDDGTYSLPIPAGTWTVRALSFGYVIDEIVLDLDPDLPTAHDVMLEPMATVTITGEVRDLSGQPLPGAEVAVAGTPLPPVTTDADGSFVLAEVPAPMTVLITASLPGGPPRAPDARALELADAPVTVTLRLAPAETFDDGTGGFSGSGDWQWGNPVYPSDLDPHSGTRCWATNLAGNYFFGIHDLTSPEYDLTDAVDPRLAFWQWYRYSGPYDGGNVSISIDGGGSWQVIEPVGGYDDPCVFWINGAPCEPGYTSSSHQWAPAVFDLTDYIGETVRFRLHLGGMLMGTPGWYLDDWAVHSAGTVTAAPAETRFQTYLRQPWPTPAGGASNVAFGLASPSRVTLKVYDLAGRRVRSLVDGSLAAGRYTFRWDGRDGEGREASQGIYFLRLHFAGEERGVLTRKIVLVR